MGVSISYLTALKLNIRKDQRTPKPLRMTGALYIVLAVAKQSGLLTGGSRGIGRVLALELAKAGACVAVLGKTLSPHPVLPGTLTETVNEVKKLGGEGLAIQCDVRHDDEVERAVQRCVEHFGSIDIVIHNAGALWWKSILRNPSEQIRPCDGC